MSAVAARLQQLLQARRAGGVGAEWFVVAGALLWFSWPTFLELHERWLDYGYQHGYPVLALTVWLVAREIRRAPLASSAPSVLGFVSMSIAVVGVLVARAATTLTVVYLFLPLVWLCAVWACSGSMNARRLASPLLYFYFATPLWGLANEPLRRLTVVVVSTWLHAVDVPAYIDGNLIHLASGTIEVTGGCSGLHFVVVGLALAVLSGLLHHERWRERLTLAGTALGASLIANWIRVFTIVIAGYLTNMQHYLIVKNHYYFGWGVFVVCWVPVILLDRYLQRRSKGVLAAAPVSARLDEVVSGATVDSGSTRPALRAGRWAAAFATVVLGGGIWVSRGLETPSFPDLAALDLPAIARWSELSEWSDTRRPIYIGATAEGSSRYGRDGFEVAVYLAHYAVQAQGHEVVYDANQPQGAGTVVSQTTVAVAGREPFAELEVADRDGGRRLVWLELRVAGRPVGDEIQAKVRQAAGALLGRRDADALVLSAVCAEDCGRARAGLTEFARDAVDALYASVYQPSGGGN